MGRAKAAAVAVALGMAGAASAFALAACSAIIGIEDVRPRRDASVRDSKADTADEDVDPGVTNNPPLENILEVALGESHSCARKPGGTVRCWGNDESGQTGTGGTATNGMHLDPADVDVTDAVDIASGRAHTCIVKSSGAVACWGFNNDGQLGNGQTGNSSPVPVDVASVTDGYSIAAGATFTCAVRTSGSVACWGANGSGQLGIGNEVASATPRAVVDVDDALAVAAGQVHACALKRDGAVVCWGDGSTGQLGTGSTGHSSRPVAVSALPSAIAIAAGERSTCAITRTNAVYCWGANEVGQLGIGAANTTPNATPAQVSGLNDAIAIAAGKTHVCAVRRAGTVVCWGSGGSGQLGDGQTHADMTSPQATPVPVSGITNAIGVGAGGNHSCAPTRTGTILCWGANDSGQLGDGTTVSELSPVSVTGYP